ncbi:MAG: hypothetical protein UDG84_02065 [Thomasclavelia sp.]|nr:hypothetical protein [Thomasclavelia sp.]
MKIEEGFERIAKQIYFGTSEIKLSEQDIILDSIYVCTSSFSQEVKRFEILKKQDGFYVHVLDYNEPDSLYPDKFVLFYSTLSRVKKIIADENEFVKFIPVGENKSCCIYIQVKQKLL